MEKTIEKKNRNITIDVLRGELALLVLLGHAVQRSFPYTYESMYLFKIIYTFHMPFFILLSGYTSIYSDNLPNLSLDTDDLLDERFKIYRFDPFRDIS